MLRILTLLAAAALIVAAAWLGYVAVVAARRSEGVFVPAGAVAILLLIAAVWMTRWALGRG